MCVNYATVHIQQCSVRFRNIWHLFQVDRTLPLALLCVPGGSVPPDDWLRSPKFACPDVPVMSMLHLWLYFHPHWQPHPLPSGRRKPSPTGPVPTMPSLPQTNQLAVPGTPSIHHPRALALAVPSVNTDPPDSLFLLLCPCFRSNVLLL